MRITNPDSLWLYFLIIPIAILMVVFYFGGISGLQKLTGTWRFVAIKRIYRVRHIVSSLLFVVTLILLLVGLSGISWQKKPEKDDSIGLEVLFVLDTSKSMNAQDISPSRLGRSVSLISSILDNINGVKMGIISFKGDAIVSVPITEDRLALDSFLANVNTNIITSPGSNQEKAISLGLKSFSGNSSNKRIIVLISDGEALEGDMYKTVAEALNNDIPIYTVAAGTEEGALIPIGNNNYIKSKQGRDVVSRTDYGLLEDLSELTYGRSYRLSDPSTISQVIQDLKSMEYDNSVERIKYVNVIQYRLFIMLALLTMTLFIFFKEWRWSEIF